MLQAQRWLLILAALCAVVIAVIRASIQSVTIDEADSYIFFVNRSFHWVLYPSSNNHVLNSLLMWITTHSLGSSGLTLRMPALLGAILYIVTCYFLSRRITDQFILQFSLLICLTYNPFILDFLVAARGYSLALAFLTAAIAIPLWDGLSLRSACILASLALGFSFTANFSFAFVDLAAFLAIVLWAMERRGTESPVRVVARCVLPGLAVAVLICGYTVANWKRSEIWWGAQSLQEMTESLVLSSLYQLNPRFWPGFYRAVYFVKPLLLPALGILCVVQLAVTRLEGSWFEDARARRLGRYAAALGGIGVLAVFVHWLAFRIDHFPLPMGRTGIYLVPLLTLIAGIIAAAPARSAISRWLHRAIIGVFICLACYFLLCLRVSYFKEWQWDADVKDVYSVLAQYNHAFGVKDVGMTWWYCSALNYYRTVSNAETFAEFRAGQAEPTGDESI
jgi:hypothetical protein